MLPVVDDRGDAGRGQVACFVSHNDGLLCREVPPPASGTPGLSGNEREGEQMNNIESIRDLIAQKPER